MISTVAHFDHPIRSPVGEVYLERLLTRVKPPAVTRILDLGCGRTGSARGRSHYSAFRNRAAIGAATLPPAPPFWTNTAKAREPR